MQYRAEIDGLRALAVLPVILFHAGFEWFSGGFIGVDVFFVISGYLITTIIISEITEGKFSIVAFYERRARRILPALFFVMLMCIPFAWMWMLPDALENFGQSLVSTSLFSNNFLLMNTSGYWDLASEYKPLMHTWSLAVEEQYYIIFPIFLVFAWRFGKNKVTWLILFISLISFTLSEYGWRQNSITNFYYSPSRAWELLAGSIAAFFSYQKGVKNNNSLAFLGLVTILYSIFTFDEEMPFPSGFTLAPVLGTLLIILYADNKTFIAKILSTKILVGFGLISYSLYLWHQPIFAFARIYKQDQITDFYSYIFLFLTIFLAFLTWKYIETPFRNKTYFSSFKIFSLSAFMMIFFISIGLYFHTSNGVPNRIFTLDAYERSTHEIKIANLNEIAAEKPIKHNLNNKHIYILGDSFASDIAYLFSYHRPTIKYTLARTNSPLESICDAKLIQKIEQLQISSIMFAHNDGFNLPCINTVISALEEKAIKVIFIGTKQFGDNMNWLARLNSIERSSLCQSPNSKKIDFDLRDVVEIPEKNYFSFFSTFSSNGCFPITNTAGDLLSSDRQHFTIAGVEYFGKQFFDNINIKLAIE
ncbi:acyltransferase [Gammaproteobacteria bacterium]|nr:acyltransferase [Gammaproteobacteria bacterium]